MTRSLEPLLEGLKTKADKSRALDRAGLTRTEIASFLGISYQHVRNTLVQGEGKARAPGVAKAQTNPPPARPWPMRKLMMAGFELISECQLGESDAFQYSHRAPPGAVVYAFAVEGMVKYVGLTRFGLRTRLGHYVHGHEGQRTSARVKKLILDALRSGRRVEVLVAQPPELQWNGLPVDGPSGLETGLIRLIKPEWKQQGNR